MMKKTLMITTAISLLVTLSGCVTYVTPVTFQESTAYVKDYEILGTFSVELPIVQKTKDIKTVAEQAFEALAMEYPDADDLIDVAITVKSRNTLILLFWDIALLVTVEGNAIRYLN